MAEACDACVPTFPLSHFSNTVAQHRSPLCADLISVFCAIFGGACCAASVLPLLKTPPDPDASILLGEQFLWNPSSLMRRIPISRPRQNSMAPSCSATTREAIRPRARTRRRNRRAGRVTRKQDLCWNCSCVDCKSLTSWAAWQLQTTKAQLPADGSWPATSLQLATSSTVDKY